VADRGRLVALVATVGSFHVTDRAMRAAQGEIEAALAAGEADDAAARAYLRAVRRYFEPYERERLYQLQYNLTAERGVVAKRVEAVRGVLEALAEHDAR
jgi:hypothetical protein